MEYLFWKLDPERLLGMRNCKIYVATIAINRSSHLVYDMFVRTCAMRNIEMITVSEEELKCLLSVKKSK